MTTDFAAFLKSANEEFDADTTTKAPSKFAKKKFTCEACGGSGLWRHGRANQHGNAKCNVCHGSGELVSSPGARAKARVNRCAAKQRKIETAHEQNMAVGDGALMQFLQANASWNSFCASLLEQDQAGRAWSDKQIDAARRMWVKIETKRRERKLENEERAAAAPKADSARIVQMFADALANGKKRRALLAGNYDDAGELANTVKMTPARDGERIWVKVDGEYCGGIAADGRLMLNRTAPGWLPERLQALAANPDAECRLYGQRTGTCSCCGRELTNGVSIDLGIGPICRGKWGLV